MTFKWYTLPALFASLIILTASAADAAENADVAKAKEFNQAGMYEQAATLLEKSIYDTPTDAEAHFQLGISYLNLREFKAADARFSSAVKLDADYEPRVEREMNRSGVKKDQQKVKDDKLKRSVHDVKTMLNLE